MEQQQIRDTVSGMNKMLAEKFAGKQDILESGVSIKTINSASLLGSGNINIPTGNMSSVDILTVRALTQTEYDAISTKDATTLYLIKEG